jgi:glucose-6-phosphate isomerase
MFETIIKTDEPIEDLTMMADKEDLDGLNYLSGKNLSFINDKAFEGTLKAHVETGGVPANVIHVKKMDAAALGNLFYFFMRACAYSAYLLGVNPFNQPGVEIYKHNMFVLLGKPGVK